MPSCCRRRARPRKHTELRQDRLQGTESASLEDAAIANLREELEVNLFGILHMIRAFAQVIVNNDGAIANILSGAALQHNPMLGSYSCTKAAASSLTIGMRSPEVISMTVRRLK